MPLDYKVVKEYEAKGVWARIAPYPERLKNSLAQRWRFHVETESVIFLVDKYFVIGHVDRENLYNQDGIQSTTGMTAWVRAFGDVLITQEGDLVIATIAAGKAPKDPAS